MTTSIRNGVLKTLDMFTRAWRSDDLDKLADVFTLDAIFHSNPHGALSGASEIAARLRSDFSRANPPRLVSTNTYVAGNDAQATLTAYLYGVLADDETESAAVFGAVLLGELRHSDDRWVFDDLRLEVTFTEGNLAQVDSWDLPAAVGWQVGDETPVIVSEIDSPWIRNVPVLTDLTPEQRVADAFTRYAWAIDQGDISLLITAYSSDASGEFTPMGHRDGRRDIIGQQKAFRRHWPYMQHFGRPLAITIHEDGSRATMIVGRVIPQQDHNEYGRRIYGAHYRLELTLADNEWRIQHFDYRPGWITAG
ncbi:nuclear transport factor 2 family protein [Rhodococcus sp. (in: high G+C Gram-positive bacteria)]|uniref:nuclear transport factor 2 family protein n=1 Tax=Rhodococcus sp. TaxID=1831 RepID=UPI00258040B3|nr:nuclear transport factor 2 family protein [Rhodococcus sp. (in: high G+C Gram-positive bacteria)]